MTRNARACTAGRAKPAAAAPRGVGDPRCRRVKPVAEQLATPTGRGQFTVERYTTDGLALLLGKKEAWTPLSSRADLS